MQYTVGVEMMYIHKKSTATNRMPRFINLSQSSDCTLGISLLNLCTGICFAEKCFLFHFIYYMIWNYMNWIAQWQIIAALSIISVMHITNRLVINCCNFLPQTYLFLVSLFSFQHVEECCAVLARRVRRAAQTHLKQPVFARKLPAHPWWHPSADPTTPPTVTSVNLNVPSVTNSEESK